MRLVTPAVATAARSAGRGRAALPRVLTVTAAVPLLALAASAAADAATTGPAAPGAVKPVYVALGDSYTSGPLVPSQTGKPSGCLRSNHDYPSLVAAAIGASSFTDMSCSGATTTNVTGAESVTFGTNPAQDSALSPATTVVTLGMGGNDIGFASIVATCATLSVTDPFGAPCKSHYTSGGADQLAAAVRATAPKIAANLQAVHAGAPDAQVFVVGYPDVLPNTGGGCWPIVPIAYGDVPYLRGVEQGLDQMLASEAAANGATYVDTYTASIGHDFCQLPGTKWVEGIIPTSPAAPVHPNALGEQGMATQVAKAIENAGG